jgi:catechol 2,3-dioxygenase-like lactoylglutathione lyase family enzyme
MPYSERLRLSVDAGRVARILRGVQFDHAAQRVPDIAAALAWWQATIPGARVLHQDESWGLLEAGGARLAFVLAEQHPDHLGWRVSNAELDRLAAEHGVAIAPHRDGTRSFYLEAPGGHGVEVIAYPDEVDDAAE